MKDYNYSVHDIAGKIRKHCDYSVRDVVCDYGVYKNEELKLICNSRKNAELIAKIMNKDSDMTKPYVATPEDLFSDEDRPCIHRKNYCELGIKTWCSNCKKRGFGYEAERNQSI
ncbi:MAG: hypothetical protein E7B14_17240 [Clostridium sp.]|nr:hypothetical protein [Clostridium sp.]